MIVDITSQMVDIAPRIVETTVIVTRGDLVHGQRYDCYQCPLARAINRHLDPEYYAVISLMYYAIRHRDPFSETFSTCFEMPPGARSLIDAIDFRARRIRVPRKIKLPLPVHTFRRTPRILPLP